MFFKNRIKDKIPKGYLVEKIVSDFFDKNISKFFSFPNPQTKKGNAQIADVLIWLKHIVILIEVKTREDNLPITDLWVKSKIDEALAQLTKNFEHIKQKDDIKLFNRFFHTFLDYENVESIIGLIVLDVEKEIVVNPSEITPDIYKKDFPIHVLSWNNLKNISDEINTVPDLLYYLKDRENYLKIADIPLCKEMEVLGYYKSKNNKFPSIQFNFIKNKYWENYMAEFKKKIKRRNKHNLYSIWMDLLENAFSNKRKLVLGRYDRKLCMGSIWGVNKMCRMLLNQVQPQTKFKGAYDTWKILAESGSRVYGRSH